MTAATIKRAFKQLDSTQQAMLLRELATSLAESLEEADRLDAEVFKGRRREERSARPWARVKAELGKGGGRRG